MIESVTSSQLAHLDDQVPEEKIVRVPPLLMTAPPSLLSFVVQDEAARFWSGEEWVSDWALAEHHDDRDDCEAAAKAAERLTGQPAFPRSLQIVAISTPA